jgi:hypothetical protein
MPVREDEMKIERRLSSRLHGRLQQQRYRCPGRARHSRARHLLRSLRIRPPGELDDRYWQTGGHTHCEFQAQQRDILEAYVKKLLVGDGTDDTNMLRAENATADLDYWMEWTPLDLQ